MCKIFKIFFLLSFAFIKFLPSYEYDLAITAIFRDEARFLKEWIEYHRLIGVQHFYLYNNLSNDNYKEVLKPYIEKRIVELIEWNADHTNIYQWNDIQCSAYRDAIEKTSKKVKWLAVIDLDEFIVLVKEKNLVKFLKKYEEYSGLGVNWQTYGTSNVQQIPSKKLLIESLKYKLQTHHRANQHVKCIVRPEYVSTIVNPHWAFYHTGCHVNADKISFIDHETPYVSIDKIRINHYWSRDIDFLLNVKWPRYVSYGRNPDFEHFYKWANEDLNQEFDPFIFDRIKLLKSSMEF